ncbi:MAG: shikimate kinase [Planctomycetes bacterium]|nr:shikimate kinase [Planctomycetota bacterium]
MLFAIMGNSGAGKSTLARWISRRQIAPLLDLDRLAWEPDRIAVARDPVLARADVVAFCDRHREGVVEGCYADLIRATFAFSPGLIFLDPGLEQCLANCRARPWEPTKYSSQEEQDARLDFLLRWVRDYYRRDDDMSHRAHRASFQAYDGPKLVIHDQLALDDPPAELLEFLS